MEPTIFEPRLKFYKFGLWAFRALRREWNVDLKGTVSVISSCPTCIDGNAQSQRYLKNISLVNVEDCRFSRFKMFALIIPICFPAVEMCSSPLIREHYWKLSVFKLQRLKFDLNLIRPGFIRHLVNRAFVSLHEGTLVITLTVPLRDTTKKTIFSID